MTLRFPSWCHIDPAMDVIEPPLLRGRTTCDYTGEVIPLTDEAAEEMGMPPALVVVKKTDGEDLVYHFKDEAAANEFYLERLREGL